MRVVKKGVAADDWVITEGIFCGLGRAQRLRRSPNRCDDGSPPVATRSLNVKGAAYVPGFSLTGRSSPPSSRSS